MKSKKKTYDLNTQVDAFYNKYASAIFPEAIEANEKELAEVSEKEAEIRSKPGLYDAGKPFDSIDRVYRTMTLPLICYRRCRWSSE